MMKRGFTLIEILVSVGIFSVVMVIALGALLAVSAGERKGETIKSVVNNLDFALESMSRTVRTGLYYHCGTSNVPGSGELSPQDCASPGSNFFIFKSNDAANPYVAYCLSGSSIWRLQAPTLSGLSTSCGSGSYLQMTAPEVKITNLTFYVNGSLGYPAGGSSACSSPGSTADCIQPRVVMAVSGSISSGDISKTDFNIQTTITQRLYDQ
jgi:prepilin-type N-terminal cleavage/methylation domain-containing protein